MDVPRGRPATAGEYSRRLDHVENDEPESRRPAPPSTYRSGKSPRTENMLATTERNTSHGAEKFADGTASELALLRTKVEEGELAKANAQVRLQRQEAEISKLERYITQLVDDRGGVGTGAMEAIVKDIEKSTVVRRSMKQISNLNADLRRKDQQIAGLKSMQTSDHVLKLAEEKEALAQRVERLIIEREDRDDGADGRHTRDRSSHQKAGDDADAKAVTETKRLRTQNSQLRTEVARLRGDIDPSETRGRKAANHHDDHRNCSDGGRREESQHTQDGTGRRQSFTPQDVGRVSPTSRRTHRISVGDGPIFHEGQAVECRETGTDSWQPAIIDSVRLTLRSLGGGDNGSADTGKKAYEYTAWYGKGGSEDAIPEYRLRAAGGDSVTGSAARRVLNEHGETVIRTAVHTPGDFVLARDDMCKDKWAHAEVLRRNDDGTYCVEFEGKGEKQNLHPMKIRRIDEPEQAGGDGTRHRTSGNDDHTPLTKDKVTEAKSISPAEEAELRYEKERAHLLALARKGLPDPLYVGQEVLAKYPGVNVWGPGIVMTSADGFYNIEYRSSRDEECVPFIFVRPRPTHDSSHETAARPGDAILAQKHDASSTGDWFLAQLKGYEGDGYCSIVFEGEDKAFSVRARGVLSLDDSHPNEHVRGKIPRNPPQPTKPVRAKKHREGGLVLACIPTKKAWTPAIITGAKGRGRYSVEWADGATSDSLLFMHIASIQEKHPVSRDVTNIKTGGDIEAQVGQGDSGNHGGEGDTTSCGTHGDSHTRGQSYSSGVDAAATEAIAKMAQGRVRLRQRQLEVGEPVLAKSLEKDTWAPGFIKNILGNGKYDVRFTNGTVVEDLSFLFIRGLDSLGPNDGGNRADDLDQSTAGDSMKGDIVYVLKRGLSLEKASYDVRDRELWRVGKVISISNGRYSVQYNEEKGKPQESRIVATRIRPRHKIRQKAAEKGDVVLAQSRIPGRGWMMGAVTERSGGGVYKIAFSDGSEEDGIRFVNLRRVVNEEDDEKQRKTEKPEMRAIRQRRFRADELALAKHPETRKWGVAKVLEAFPQGRYDLEFLGDKNTIAMGVHFQTMRHLDLAQISSDNSVLADNDDGDGVGGSTREVASDDTPGPGHRTRARSHNTDESWDEQVDQETRDSNRYDASNSGNNDRNYSSDAHDSSENSRPKFQVGDRVMLQESDSRAWCEATIRECRSRGRYDVRLRGGSVERAVMPSRIRGANEVEHVSKSEVRASEHDAFEVGAEVHVLRRGKSKTDDLENADTWRTGRIFSVRSNGTFAVEYHEAGGPKEDRIAPGRLRLRRNRPRTSNGCDRGQENGESETNANGSNTNNYNAHNENGDMRNKKTWAEVFSEGDVVLMSEGRNDGEDRLVKVDACLGNDEYRVKFMDSSGARDVQGHQMRHVKHPSEVPRKALAGSHAMSVNKRAVKMAKLLVGELVISKRLKAEGDGQEWAAAKVVEAPGDGHYMILFAGDTQASRVHFTKLKPLKISQNGEQRSDCDDSLDPSNRQGNEWNDNARFTASNVSVKTRAAGGNGGGKDLLDMADILRVADLTFNLTMAASALRRTAPRLILATGEEGDDAPWSHSRALDDNRYSSRHDGGSNNNDPAFLARAPARLGTRSPTWKGEEEGNFILSMKGLQYPVLFIGLEDAKAQKPTPGTASDHNHSPIMAEACVPVPLDRVGDDRQEHKVELQDRAGTVVFEWST